MKPVHNDPSKPHASLDAAKVSSPASVAKFSAPMPKASQSQATQASEPHPWQGAIEVVRVRQLDDIDYVG